MGIASFVIGLICLILSPFFDIYLILPSLMALLLGIIDTVIKSKKKAPKGLSIAGIVLSSIAFIICILAIIVKYFIFNTITFPSSNYNQNVNEESSIIAEIEEPILLEDFTVTLKSVDLDFKDYYSFANVDDDSKILKADFEFKNSGEYNEYISYSDFDCFADKFTCDDFLSVEDAYFYATVKPNETITGSVYFEIPDDADNIEIVFDYTSDDISTVRFEAK